MSNTYMYSANDCILLINYVSNIIIYLQSGIYYFVFRE